MRHLLLVAFAVAVLGVGAVTWAVAQAPVNPGEGEPLVTNEYGTPCAAPPGTPVAATPEGTPIATPLATPFATPEAIIVPGCPTEDGTPAAV